MKKDKFYKELKKLGIELTDFQKKQFQIYSDTLIEYNKHTNLTSIKTEEEIYLKHFYDSLMIFKNYDFNNKEYLDVGTGAGFPGVVIKILFPTVKLTLLDSNNKKIEFLKFLIDRLELNDVVIISGRIEKQTRYEQYDCITARAVSQLNILLELCIPYLKINGTFIALKGKAEDEIELSSKAFKELDCLIESNYSFNLPFNSGYRNILYIKKIKSTKSMYPRNYDKIKKKPLK